MCRRAAAAAFQECVGRLGSFQNGIDILTAADFFTLASRHNAYLSVAPFVASFAPFRRPLASHLFSSKVAHWDASVREVAAKGLAALVGSDTAFFAVDVVDDLVPRALDSVLEVRHGAALALAAVVRALAAAGVGLEAERATRVVGVAPGVDKARLFRGKGGEIMRGAVCRVIGAVADARLGEFAPRGAPCMLWCLSGPLRASLVPTHGTPHLDHDPA